MSPLPEYRALKERYTFLELVQTPELAAEVTLPPIRRLGFDAGVEAVPIFDSLGGILSAGSGGILPLERRGKDAS